VLRVVEACGDEASDGKITELRRAVKAGADERMKLPDGMDLPFDGKRMICARFTRVVTLEKCNEQSEGRFHLVRTADQ